MNALEQTLLITVIQGLFVAGAAFYFNKKLESFKHDLLHKVNARKILIEKELEFYSQLFKVLTDLRSVTAELTSPTFKRLPDETFLDWNQGMYVKAAAPFNELYKITWSYRPFYPESLYPKVDNLRTLTHNLLGAAISCQR